MSGPITDSLFQEVEGEWKGENSNFIYYSYSYIGFIIYLYKLYT